MKEFESPEYFHDLKCARILIWSAAGVSAVFALVMILIMTSACTMNFNNYMISDSTIKTEQEEDVEVETETEVESKLFSLF